MRLLSGFMLVSILPAAISGCNYVGPIAYLVHGPGKIEARHTLEVARPTVIFVDDSMSQLPSRSIRGEIAASVERFLLKEEKLKDVIDHRSALQASIADRHGQSLSIAEIGRSVGAEVVIYIEIDSFGISPDGQTFSPFAAARVKVVDVAKDARAWPDDRRGHPVKLDPTPQAIEAPESTAAKLEAARLLAAQLGKAVAQLFYTHEPDQAAGQGDLRREGGLYADPS
jgi:hypothetical protein